MSYRAVIVTRYPRVDSLAWKLELAERLERGGAELAVLYSKASFADQARAGLREYGLDAVRVYGRSRGGGPARPTLATWAEERGLPVWRHRTLRDPEVADRLSSFAPDVCILAGSDLVPAELLRIPRLGTINPHYGLLPAYRGMNVAEWSVFQDDPVAVSVHRVEAGVDTGDVLAREAVSVGERDSLDRIRAAQQEISARLLAEVAAALVAGTATVRPQPEEGRQWYRMHPLVREAVEAKLAAGRYAWAGRVPGEDDLEAASAARPAR